LPLHQLAALAEITGAGGRHHVPGFRGGIPHDAAQELQDEILKTVRRSLATATIHHGSWWPRWSEWLAVRSGSETPCLRRSAA
jgi:hypothetical protein